MFEAPQSRKWLAAGMVTILLGAAAMTVQRMGLAAPADVLLAITALAGFWCLALFVRWAGLAWAEVRNELRQGATITPYLAILQAAARLTPEQARLVPRMEAAGVAFGNSPSGKLKAFLITPDGLVPWEMVEKFLGESSFTNVYPIRRTNDRTPEREYIRAFTDWLVVNGFATWGTGPDSAQWVNAESRGNVARLLEIELPNVLDE